jgi:transcriptional regulator with XRE-family HTH domain
MKIGKILARLREEANISQKQLAERMNTSPSKVSRMEAETVPLSEQEISQYLKALGTTHSTEFMNYIPQEWFRIPKPPFFHPSRQALRIADVALAKIDELRGEIDPNNVFYKELDMHYQTIVRESEYLLLTDHTVACIGRIAVGKTTAICGFSRLKVKDKPLLHAAGGRSTICEVQIQQGPEYGVSVEPVSEDELYKYIYDFCDYLLSITADKDDRKKFVDAENFSLSTEIERCIRNMAGLTSTVRKKEDGHETEDLAVNLINELKGAGATGRDKLGDELKMQVLLRLNIDNRKKTEIWFSPDSDEDPLFWLKDNYFKINHGRHPEFAIPKRITINIPEPVLGYGKLNLTIVDTKGVDDTAKREDLETHLNDPRALTIFCSRFLDAPDETTETLIERAISLGIKDRLLNETAVMVLPRGDEAVSVNTFDGSQIEEAEVGYMIRENDIRQNLMKYDLRDLSIMFYNEQKEASEKVKNFIIGRVEAIRKAHEDRIEVVARTIVKVSENVKDSQARSAYSAVLKTLTAWIKTHKDVSHIGNAHQSLIDTILEKRTYASSVRASVNRYGSWSNLDYYYLIGTGARAETVKSISSMLSELYANIDTMQARDDLEPAHEFLQELKLYCKSEAENLYKEIQSLGKDIFREKLTNRDDVWNALQARWGQGPGYKIDISANTARWFDEDEQKRVYELVQERVAKSWRDLLSKIEELAKGIFE